MVANNDMAKSETPIFPFINELELNINWLYAIIIVSSIITGDENE